MKKKISICLTYIFSSASLFATNATWNTNNSGDWNINGNWTPATFPNAIDDTANFQNIISSPAAISLGTSAQNITVGTVNIDSGQAYTIQSGNAGNTLIFDVSSGSAALNITTVNGNASHSITTPVTLNDTLIITSTASTPSISGIIQGSGGLTKSGSGTVQISGSSSNTYTGTTSILGGTLQLAKSSGNALAGDVLLNGGGLSMSGHNQIPATSTVTVSNGTFSTGTFSVSFLRLNLNGGSLIGPTDVSLTSPSTGTALSMRNGTFSTSINLTQGGSVEFDSTNNGTANLTGNLNLGGNTTTFNISNGTASIDMNISGVISNGGVTKTGAGTLQFSGSSSNTYTGTTSILGGTLQLTKNSANALGGDVLLNGGGLNMTGSNQIPATSTITISNGTFSSGTFSLTFKALNLSTNGSIAVSSPASLTLTNSSPGTALSMQNNTIATNINLTGGGSVVFDSTNNGTATLSGNLNLGGNTPIFDIGNGTASIDMNLSGIISNGGLTKSGSGTLQLSGSSANTYAGTTSVLGGTLLLNKSSGNALAGDILLNGGDLTMSGSNQAPATSTVTISNGTFSSGTFALAFKTLNLNSGGNFLATAPATLTLNNSTTALSMQNTTLSTNINLTGGGSVVFDSTNNGTATISSNINLGSNPTIFTIGDGTADIDMNLSGIISNGGLTKSGSGILQISGSSANTYTGTTSVLAGTLELNKSSGNALMGDVSLNGGNLTLLLANQIPTTSTVTISSGTFNAGTFPLTLATLNLNSGSNFSLAESADLTLTSNSTALSMQNVTLANSVYLTGGGGIVFDPANNGTALITGNIELGNNTTVFDVGNGSAAIDMSISGAITNGGLTKQGLGTLLLNGQNSYTGGTLISAGTVQGNTTSLQGDITDDAHLIFDQSDTGTYSGQITGTGTLVKQGSGTLILPNHNSLGGTTTVTSGTLVINGLLNGAGTLVISPGAMLQGTGTISKDSTISGTLSPGNSIGIMHFLGDQTLTTGAALDIELNPSSSDLVDVTGSFTLQPGVTLNLMPSIGVYTTPMTYTIVQTTGGVNGTFSQIIAPPLFNISPSYSPLNIILLLQQTPFASLFTSGNAGAVAGALDSTDSRCSNQAEVTSALMYLPTEQDIKDALLQMQPSAFTSLAVMQENDLSYLRNALYNRLEIDLHSCCFNPFAPISQRSDEKQSSHITKENTAGNDIRKRNLTLWMTALTAHTSQNNHHEEPGFIANSPGILLGFDARFGTGTYFGGGLGYTHTHLHWKQHRGEANMQGVYGTVYGRWASSHAYVQGALIGGYSFYSTHRNIKFGTIIPIKGTTKGHHNGVEGSAHLRTGFNYGCRYMRFSPFIGVDYFYVHENSFHEHGAESLNLRVQSKNSDLLSSEAGIDFSHCFGSNSKTFAPFIKPSIIRESRFKGKKEKASFECGDSDFTVTGLYPSRTLAGIGAGFNTNIFNHSLSLFYQGKFKSSYSDNSWYLQYGYIF